jgi:hypothetical protein
LNANDLPLVVGDLRGWAEKMRDPIARAAVLEFLASWETELPKGETVDALSS